LSADALEVPAAQGQTWLHLREGRRLTGPNLLLDGPGAAVEVEITERGQTLEAIAGWRQRAGDMAAALGWQVVTASRLHASGASLALAAPIDVLQTAVELAEWAVIGGDPAVALSRLQALRDAEAQPRLLALAANAGLEFLHDDEAVTVGLGAHSRSWALVDLPHAEAAVIADLGTIPLVVVTGTNGKTTTARLLARILGMEGAVVGLTSTDALSVGGELVEAGDWSGPGGARRLLRDRRVGCAVLETARGGLLRRGLAVRWADVAVVINVAADHLGEWGIDDLDAMAEAKLIVRKGLKTGGLLVLNADSPPLCAAAVRLGLPDGPYRLAWFSRNPQVHLLAGHAPCAWADDARGLVWRPPNQPLETMALRAVPITHAGRAVHNVENCLAAILAAQELCGATAIRGGLASFGSTVADNPGRANLFAFAGATVLVDFAHNPDGIRQLAMLTADWPTTRRLIVLGQAGDRSDADLYDLAQAALACCPDHVILKESLHYLRGRPLGEVSAVLAAALVDLHVPNSAVALVADEDAAVQATLDWCQPGDLAILLVHDDFAAAVATLAARGARELTSPHHDSR